MEEQTCNCTCHELMGKFNWPESGIKAHWCCPKIKEAVKIIPPGYNNYAERRHCTNGGVHHLNTTWICTNCSKRFSEEEGKKLDLKCENCKYPI